MSRQPEGSSSTGSCSSSTGYQGDELWAIDGWETREQCDRGMDNWGPAMAAEGVSMDGMNLEEFEIDSLLLSGREIAAVS